MPSDACPTCGDTSPLDECPDCGAYPSRLTPTASEATAIGAGEDAAFGDIVESARAFYDAAFKDGQDDDYNPETAIARSRLASPKVASDTAPGVQLLLSAVERIAHYEGGTDYTCHKGMRGIAKDALAALAASPTASDTDTAIPGGNDYDVVGRAKSMAAKGGPHEWGYRDPLTGDFMRDDGPFHAVEYIAAASPKPDTDTPVDPGVEGVREVERDIRIAIWNAGMASAMGQNRTQAFIRRAMAEPMMARALAALAAKPIAGTDAGEVYRSACDCACHEPGAAILHVQPCCWPDPRHG